MENSTLMKSLVQPIAKKPTTRRVKSFDVEMLVQFGICTNVEGYTNLPLEALGAPYRLATTKDGTVRFTQSGNVSIRVAKEIVAFGTMIHQNIVAGIQADIARVHSERANEVSAMLSAAEKAGKPIVDSDNQKLADALVMRAKAEAEGKVPARDVAPTPEPEKALVAA